VLSTGDETARVPNCGESSPPAAVREPLSNISVAPITSTKIPASFCSDCLLACSRFVVEPTGGDGFFEFNEASV
jgi:hypothetical protein